MTKQDTLCGGMIHRLSHKVVIIGKPIIMFNASDDGKFKAKVADNRDSIQFSRKVSCGQVPFGIWHFSIFPYRKPTQVGW